MIPIESGLAHELNRHHAEALNELAAIGRMLLEFQPIDTGVRLNARHHEHAAHKCAVHKTCMQLKNIKKPHKQYSNLLNELT